MEEDTDAATKMPWVHGQRAFLRLLVDHLSILEVCFLSSVRIAAPLSALLVAVVSPPSYTV